MNNIADIGKVALEEDWRRVDLATWGNRPLMSGLSPERRRG
jgi:hypothetical protein